MSFEARVLGALMLLSAFSVTGTPGCSGSSGANDNPALFDASLGDSAPTDFAPVVGEGPVFQSLTENSVRVNWAAATDDLTAQAALQYKLVQSTNAELIDTLSEIAEITGGAQLLVDFQASTLSWDVHGLQEATSYAFAVVVSDAGHNQALYAPATVTTVDISPPTIAITAPSDGGSFVTAAPTFDIAGTAADLGGVASVAWANAANAASGTAIGTTAWTAGPVALEIGSNLITVTAIDFAGLTSSEAIVVTRNHASISLATGVGHSCALLADGRVKCWGSNLYGQLGLGDTANRGDEVGEMGAALPPVDLGAGRTAVALTAGGFHTCALLDNGDVKCWGRSNYGQLGLGNLSNRGDAAGEMGDGLPAVNLGTGAIVVELGAGYSHTCARFSDASVKCWGRNDLGQLGLGDQANRGDGESEMGDMLFAVDLGAGRTAAKLVVGGWHACAQLDNDSIKCWGFNLFGQLGLGDAVDHGDAPGEMGDNLAIVDLGMGRTAATLRAGARSTCAQLDDGAVKCWGENEFGQLGLGDVANRGDTSGEMGAALPAVDIGNPGSTVSLALGEWHACALFDDSAFKCWGRNNHFQLGVSGANQGDQAGEMGDALISIELGSQRQAIGITTGWNHTCALLDDGSVTCWGQNGFGQLGLGDVTDTRAGGQSPVEL